MDLDVIFLGTGGSVPSARRNTASVLVRRGGDRLLFDCGEGTQRQMQRSTGLVQVHGRRALGAPARSSSAPTAPTSASATSPSRRSACRRTRLHR
jgi:hypothetical protein